ncbi:hypothetical protein [Bacillus thuringiensis]|uniref:hypothetical protein n=1 Tax=Bacillus thuringiensis TaxID=1428 RepID=UPI0033368A1D
MTIDFLRTRLGIKINEKKFKVVNLKKNAFICLGFKVKLVQRSQSKYGSVANFVFVYIGHELF